MSDKILRVLIGGPISMHLRAQDGPDVIPFTDDDFTGFDDHDTAILYCANCDIHVSISVLRAWVELGNMEPCSEK